MAFKTIRQPANNDSVESDRPKVDFDAMHKYIVDTCNLTQPETLIGVVSGIIDLGVQKIEDAEMEFNGTEEDEAKAIEEKPATYFKDGVDGRGKKRRLKCWPQRPFQSVTIAVDFPDIMLDLSPFFGEPSNPRPLRMYLGRQFYNSSIQRMVVGKPISLKETNIAPKGEKAVWSLAKNHTLHRLAVAAKLIEPHAPFKPEQIDQLLGKSFQWSVQCYMKPSKGKEYFTQEIRLVGGLGRGQSSVESVVPPFVVQFDEENDPVVLKELKNHVINTIRMAENFSGSKIEKQLEQYRGNDKPAEDTPKEGSAPAEKASPQKAAKPKAAPIPPADSDYDDDIPF